MCFTEEELVLILAFDAYIIYRSALDDNGDLSPSDEGRLTAYIMNSQNTPTDKIARPVRNSSTTVQVQLGLFLYNILKVDEMSQSLTTRMWTILVIILSIVIHYCAKICAVL